MSYATSSDGVRVFYTTMGQGEPIVLSHGGTHTWESWEDLGYTEALKERFQLILIDSRGHGRSDKPHDVAAYTYQQQADDVVAVVNDLGMTRFHFFGYSMGAEIAFPLAALVSERLQSIIAYGGHPYERSDEDRAFVDQINATLRQGMQAWVDRMESQGVFAEYPKPAVRKERLLAGDADALKALNLASVEFPGVADSLSRITTPCLLIAGQHDAVNEQAHRAARELADADFVSVGGIRHAMVHARTILPYVHAFLELHGMWPAEQKRQHA